MGVVNSKMGVTAKFSRAFRAHSVLCLPTEKFLRAPLTHMCKGGNMASEDNIWKAHHIIYYFGTGN